MKYRSFIIKSIVFIALFAGFDFLIGKVYRLLENKALEHSPYGMVTEYTMWKVNADVVIVGASEANHSYIPSLLQDGLGMSVYNCGKDGCRFYYQNAMINGILDRYNPKMIIWSISPNEFCVPSQEDKDNLSQLNPFYKDNDICKQALITKSKFEPLKLLLNSYCYNSRLFPYIYKSIMPDYSYEYGGYAPLYGSNKNLQIKEIKWKDSYDSVINQAFDNTINRCVQNGVQIVFVFTPRLEKGDYQDLFSYKQLRVSINQHDLPIIEDLYHDSSLMKPSLYKDNAHLNNEGALIFNELLLNKIKHLIPAGNIK